MLDCLCCFTTLDLETKIDNSVIACTVKLLAYPGYVVIIIIIIFSLSFFSSSPSPSSLLLFLLYLPCVCRYGMTVFKLVCGRVAPPQVCSPDL